MTSLFYLGMVGWHAPVYSLPPDVVSVPLQQPPRAAGPADAAAVAVPELVVVVGLVDADVGAPVVVPLVDPDVGQPGVAVDEVDPAGDAVEVRVADDVDELLDGPVRVQVLDVGLVLPDQLVQRQRVEPHGVVDVAAVLVGVLELGRLHRGLHVVPPDLDALARLHHGVVVGVDGVDQAEVALNRLEKGANNVYLSAMSDPCLFFGIC